MTRRCLFLTLALATSAMCAAGPVHAEPAHDRAAELTREVVKLGTAPRGIGAMTELREVLADVGLAERTRLLQRLAKAKLHPLTRAQVAHELAAAELAAGDRAAAVKRLREGGWLLDWEVLGPFADPGSVESAVGPEQGNGPVFAGRHGEIEWKPLGDRTHLGVVDVQSLIRPMDASVAYARTTLTNKRRTRLVLRVAARGPYRVFLDGKAVGGQTEGLGSDPESHADTQAWLLDLPAGESTLWVKVSGAEGAVDFTARLTPGREATTPLEALVAAARSPRDLARAALLARRTRPSDSTDPEVELARRARAAGEIDPDTNALLAAAAAHEYERHQALEAAATARPDDPWLSLLLARAWFGSSGDALVVAARGRAQALVDAHPDFAAARRFLLTILLEENMLASATAQARVLSETASDNPKALADAVSAAGQTHDKELSWTLCERRRACDAASLSVTTDCVGQAVERGEFDTAREWVREGLRLRPDVTGLHGLAAQVEFAAGDLDAARAQREKLAALVPGESSYWIDLGLHDAEFTGGVEAAAAFARALAIEPQNADLEQYAEYLDPSSAVRPEDAWVLPVQPLSDEDELARFGDEDYYYLIDQNVTRVFDSGLTTTFVQQVAKVRTDVGAGSLRTVSVGYTPDSQAVKVRKVQVTKPDGTVRETWQTFEQSLSEPWYNLYYDYSAMVIALPELGPGDLIEVQYTIQQTGSTNILGDYFGDIVTLQDSAPKILTRYTLLGSKDRKIVARKPTLPHDYTETETEDGLAARTWTFRDVPKVATEDARPGYTEIADYIHLSTYETWGEVTRWYWDLVDEQLVVDSEIRKIVAEQTDGVTDRREKVAKLHNWVVQNTRYVGLEFGIHGFKPYRTTECLKRRFGDCKDKASLIKVMLETAGIDANIVLVRTRRNGRIDATPASLQIFDHAIAYVPEFDLFLDGTAEYSGTNELPWGDQGVQVLIVKNGGAYELRDTPVLPATSNTVLTSYSVDLTKDIATVDVGSVLTGAFAAGWRERYQTKTEREERFKDRLGGDFPGAQLGQLQFSDLDALEQPVKVSYRFTDPDLGERTDSEIRVPPALRPARLLARLAGWPKREQVLEVGHPFVSQESVTLTVPAGARLTSKAGETMVESQFGFLKLEVAPTPTGATVTATLQVNAHRVSPDAYPKFRDWLRAVDQALLTPLVFDRNAN